MATESPSYLLGKCITLLDRAAEQLLRDQLGISYKRVVFLFVLQYHGTVSQHRLAETLGYSDPAVSTMLQELIKAGYVSTAPDPEHGRKRLVSMTQLGSTIAAQARHILDRHFDELLQRADVDAEQLTSIAVRLLQALTTKTRKD